MWRKGEFSKSHASGVVALIFIVLFIQGILFLFRSDDEKASETIVENPEPVGYTVKAEKSERRVSKVRPGTSEKTHSDRQFDPNIIDRDGLMDLGLSSRQAQVIINYRNSGGKFRKREDFSKMYVISPETYERLKNLISIDSCSNHPVQADSSRTVIKEKFEAKRIVRLNMADSTELVSLPGIGPYYARKIIQYREKLGGFVLKDQLLDIYGIDRERLSLFAERVALDTNEIVKKDFNEATFEDLSGNPYIGGYVARSIIRYREKCGRELTDLANLVLNNIIRKELYKILKYYFR